MSAFRLLGNNASVQDMCGLVLGSALVPCESFPFSFFPYHFRSLVSGRVTGLWRFQRPGDVRRSELAGAAAAASIYQSGAP